MKTINSRQYKLLISFCRQIFKDQKYISQKRLNLLIQKELNPCSTRYRRNLIELKLIFEKNMNLYPGSMLYFFKQKDFFTINKLMKNDEVKITENLIQITSQDTKTINVEFPETWELIHKSKTKLIFNVKNITTNH
ncbi:hypothetical protein [Chryseobacterium sp.]|uniref:hypothetical protein n=1 Tax=Chryseobacterium sp. TaxID=1871047 RepID=UPI0026265267|nr:hypothetical protein [Chryseobacterium sp.]